MKFSSLCRTLIFCLFFSQYASSQNQAYVVPNNNVFRSLSNSKSGFIKVNNVVNKRINLLPLDTYPYTDFLQDLLWYNGSLYIYLPASGVLYKSKDFKPADTEVTFDRIDSTKLVKYNIDCYSFIYRDTIFNLGGYGFWRWNGQLRYFNEISHEWDIAPLNKEFPIDEAGKRWPNVWYNAKSGKLISLYYKIGNEAISNASDNKTELVDSVIELNLNTKKWEVKGSLTEELKSNFNQTYKIAELDSGLVVYNNGNIEYWNLISNSIFKLANSNYKYFLISKLGSYPLIWNDDKTIFYATSFSDSSVDSVHLDLKDFVDSGKPIYLTTTTGGHLYYLLSGILILFVMLFIFFFYKRKRSSLQIMPSTPNEKNQNSEVFSVIESVLISLIIKNHREFNRNTTVDEVNKVLGITYKSIDVQKRKRSDTINSINSKYSLCSGKKDNLLINRVKTEIDRRVNEFYINKEDIDTVESLGILA